MGTGAVLVPFAGSLEGVRAPAAKHFEAFCLSEGKTGLGWHRLDPCRWQGERRDS